MGVHMSFRHLLKPTLAAFAAGLMIFGYCGGARADDQDNAAMKEQMRQLMQRIDELSRQVDALQKQQQPAPVAATPSAPQSPAATPSGTGAGTVPAPVVNAAPVTAAPEPKFDAFMKDYKSNGGEPLLQAFLKGFYGTLDVSYDYTTKGIIGLTAYS
jgi:hypothetical protein